MDPLSDLLLTLQDVRFGYRRGSPFLGPVDLDIAPGECWAILGPNGAGKSTLLRLMAGLLQPTGGEIQLDGKTLAGWSAARRARHIAFLPQHAPADLDLTARELVLLGRFPHRSLGLFESAEDHVVAERVMALTATLPFAERPLRTLSGGEAQRVHLAAALAQTPRLLLLDEPTASLDLRHQWDMLQLIHDRVKQGGLAVVFVTHDINLAGQFASRVMVLREGHAVAAGPPLEVLRPEVLESVYEVELVSLPVTGPGARGWLVPRFFPTEPLL